MCAQRSNLTTSHAAAFALAVDGVPESARVDDGRPQRTVTTV